jgi:hypothetical protein
LHSLKALDGRIAVRAYGEVSAVLGVLPKYFGLFHAASNSKYRRGRHLGGAPDISSAGQVLEFDGTGAYQCGTQGIDDSGEEQRLIRKRNHRIIFRIDCIEDDGLLGT